MRRNWKRILAAILAACMIFSNSSLVYAMESLYGQEEASVEAEASETNLTEPVEDETWNSDEELADDTVIVETEEKQDLFDTAESEAKEEIDELNVSEPISFSTVYINPLYADVITEDDLVHPSETVTLADDIEYASDIDEAAANMRAGLVAREQTIRFGYSYEGTVDEEAGADKIHAIAEKAFEHTGNPQEGDYLLWQYAGWEASAAGHITDGILNLVYTYTVTYYTTAEQENRMNQEVKRLLSELALDEENDYKKIKSIYDYICSNITYDNENLVDDTYLLKHTAYAALINKTAVCQGYAVLFYRLALESGVDARVITGDAGGAHAWNIAKLGNCYYNLDSTWDAGKESYAWVLKCDADFPEHTRSVEYGYASEEFYAAYPMAEKSYDPENAILNFSEGTDDQGQSYLRIDSENYDDYTKFEAAVVAELQSKTETYDIVEISYPYHNVSNQSDYVSKEVWNSAMDRLNVPKQGEESCLRFNRQNSSISGNMNWNIPNPVKVDKAIALNVEYNAKTHTLSTHTINFPAGVSAYWNLWTVEECQSFIDTFGDRREEIALELRKGDSPVDEVIAWYSVYTNGTEGEPEYEKGVNLFAVNVAVLEENTKYTLHPKVYLGSTYDWDSGEHVLNLHYGDFERYGLEFCDETIVNIFNTRKDSQERFDRIEIFYPENTKTVSKDVWNAAVSLLSDFTDREVMIQINGGNGYDLNWSAWRPEETESDVILSGSMTLGGAGEYAEVSFENTVFPTEEMRVDFNTNEERSDFEDFISAFGESNIELNLLDDSGNEMENVGGNFDTGVWDEGRRYANVNIWGVNRLTDNTEYSLTKNVYRGHVEENGGNTSLYVSSLDMGKEKFDNGDLEKIVQYYIDKGKVFDVVHLCEAYSANNTIKASYINLAKQILSKESKSEKRVSFIFSQSEDKDGRWYQNEFMWSLINPGKASKNINANFTFNILEGKGISVKFNSNTYNADEVFVNFMVNKDLDIGQNMIDVLDSCERVMALKKGTEVVENINVNLDGMQEENDGREEVNLFIGNVNELSAKTEYVLVGVHEFGEILVGEKTSVIPEDADKDTGVTVTCYSPDMGTASEDGTITAVNTGAPLYFAVSYQSGDKEVFDFWTSEPVVKIQKIAFYESDFEAIYWPTEEYPEDMNLGGLGVRYYPSNTGMDPADLIWTVEDESEKGKVLELVPREEEEDRRLDGTYRLLGPGTATIRAALPDNKDIYAEITITSVAWKEVPEEIQKEADEETFAVTNFDTKLKDVELPKGWSWEYPETDLKPFLETDGQEFPAIYTGEDGDEYYAHVWIHMVTIEGLHLSALGVDEENRIIEIDTPKAMTVGDTSVWGVCVNLKNAREDDMKRLSKLLEAGGRLSMKWSDNFTATGADSIVGENAEDCRTFKAESKGKKTLTVSLVDTKTNKVLAKDTKSLTVYTKPLADFSKMSYELVPDENDWTKGVIRFTFEEGYYYKLSSVKASDSKVLKLGKPVVSKEDGKFITEVSYADGVPGWTQVILTAADDAKSTFVIDHLVKEKEPKVLQTGFEINKAFDDDVAEVTINFADKYPLAEEGNGIEVVGKYAETFKFESGNDRNETNVADSGDEKTYKVEGHLKLKNQELRNGSYKVELKIPVDFGDEGVKDYYTTITIKVIDKAPSVKLTQTQKVNIFYLQTRESTDGYGVLKIDTGKLWMIGDPEIEAEDFKLIKAEDGTYYLMCTEKDVKALNKNIKVKLHLQDETYGTITVEKALTVKTEDKAPTVTASAKTGTFYTKLGIFYSWFTLKNKATDTPLNISEAYVVANKMKTELSGEDGTTVGTAKNRFDIRFENDMVHFLATEGGAMAATTDQFKVGIREENWSRPIEVSYSIKTVTSVPKLSLGSSTLTLNVNEEVRDSQLATTKLTLSSRDDSIDGSVYFVGLNDASKAVLNKGLVLEYDWDQACIRARFNIDASDEETMVKPGTYQYKVVADLWNGNGKLTSNIKVTVTDKAVDKCVKITRKGTIDILRRGSSGITFSPKVSSLSGTVVDGWVTGQDTYKFDWYTDNGKLVVTAREGANFSTKNNYKINLVFILENQDGSCYEVVTSEQAVKVIQGKPKVTVKAPEGTTLYSQAGNELKLRFAALLANEDIKIRDVSLLNYTDDLECKYDEASQTIYLRREAMKQITSNGKTWSLKFAVTYTDSAGNEKAAQVTSKITIK